MEYITEMHIHSRYSRACSEQLTLDNIDATAYRKGIGIIGTGDFTHPLWFKDIKEKLEESEQGLYRLRGSSTNVRFLLGTEICTIFSNGKTESMGVFDKSGNVKKIHHVVLAPDIETVEEINDRLSKFGSLSADGRPILSMRASELAEVLHSISKDIFLFPAHAWTPWFGVFGSFSGFDSIEDAYEDQAQYIYAAESGLSADPSMFWRISRLDKYAIVSGSDAHSLPKMGREATTLEMDPKNLSYNSMINSIKDKRIKYTIEFYPEEGKYHYDGHRQCKMSLSPAEARKYNGICPVCRKKLTIGVLHRVEELADREEGFAPKGAAPFVHAVPLVEILSYLSGKGTGSSYVLGTYEKLLEKFGTEMNVLLKSSIDEIRAVDKDIAAAIDNVREGHVTVIPGYDGVFGIVDIANKVKKVSASKTQKSISDF